MAREKENRSLESSQASPVRPSSTFLLYFLPSSRSLQFYNFEYDFKIDYKWGLMIRIECFSDSLDIRNLSWHFLINLHITL